MKIAFVSYWSCPLTRIGVLNAGGMSVYQLNLANELGKLGCIVDIYTKTHLGRDEEVVSLHRNVNIIHLKVKKRSNNYLSATSFARSIIRYVNSNSLAYDIYHAHYFYSGMTCLELKKKFSVSTTIITFHTLAKMKDLYGGIKDKKRERVEIKISKKIDGVISSTELEREELIKYYNTDPKKIYVVPPGVNHRVFKKRGKDKSREKLNIDKDKSIILFVGRIDPIKGISILIEAIIKLVKEIPSFHNKYRLLLIGGDIKSRNFWKNKEVIKIKNIISSKGLSCCIKFIGSKPHNVLPFYYSASDIVVMPSVYESFGLVVIEAMAVGACVIVSSVGGLKYLIDDKINGRLFESGNVSNLKKILWEVLNDSEQRERLGRGAIFKSQQFCWKKQAEKIVNIYNKFL